MSGNFTVGRSGNKPNVRETESYLLLTVRSGLHHALVDCGICCLFWWFCCIASRWQHLCRLSADICSVVVAVTIRYIRLTCTRKLTRWPA